MEGNLSDTLTIETAIPIARVGTKYPVGAISSVCLVLEVVDGTGLLKQGQRTSGIPPCFVCTASHSLETIKSLTVEIRRTYETDRTACADIGRGVTRDVAGLPPGHIIIGVAGFELCKTGFGERQNCC